MRLSRIHLFAFSCGLDGLGQVAGHVARSPQPQCGVSSAYSVLSTLPTASAFCSSLLYPNGPCTVTKTVVSTSTKPCKTGTTTETEYTTKTVIKTKSTTLPVITKYSYTSTVLVPSGHHRPVGKRAVPAATTPSSPTTAYPSQCSPTPSQLCDCPPHSISAACSSVIPSPPPITTTVTDVSTVKCPKTEVTVTKTVVADKITSTYTLSIFPPPIIVPETGVLTTTVPAPCASAPYVGTGYEGVGDIVLPVQYPFFALTMVECCIVCFDEAAIPNCVASAFIESALDCQMLQKVNKTAGQATSRECPLGIEDYPFGQPNPEGNLYPGPCGY